MGKSSLVVNSAYFADMMRKFITLFLFLFSTLDIFSQSAPKGHLFIIGGGKRSPELMRSMLTTAGLRPQDYIVVLPMASEETDTAFYYVKSSLEHLCSNTIADLNFTKEKVQDKKWVDSLQHAKLIFISGGDQSRFMNVVMNTPVYTAIHKAFENGATIAGTSAGAAVMSKYMITGNELRGDTAYHENFRRLWNRNLEIKEGLGLLPNAIIDQHFIMRSRYNRLISAIAQYPTIPCIGIDEATAIIVSGNKVKVAGDSQVILIRHPEGLKITDKGLIKFNDLHFAIFTAGDEFAL